MPFDPNVLELGRLYTRPYLAKLWGYRGYQAIARGVITPRGGRHIILFVTRQKQETFTQFQDFISGDYLHWEGESAHGSDDRVARAHEKGEEIHLFYRDIHHTPFRFYGPLQIVRFTRRTTAPSEFVFRLVHDLSPEDDITTHSDQLATLPPTERIAVTKARLGQGDFRERLLARWHGCAVTGIETPELLRASHIKPWRSSTNQERLDEFNGLPLLPQYDHLFDRGYITFDSQGLLVPSPAIVTLPPRLLGIEMQARLRQLTAEHLPFLEFHQNEVFLSRVEKE
jgi:putative restriction endonuclease